MFNLLKTKNYKPKTNKGFSVVELIMVVAIMTMITSVVLYNHARFSGGVLLENLAYEIALTVRQAQFFGMNVRQVRVGSINTFDAGYGVYFNSGDSNQFIFFADTDNNKVYDSPNELIEIYNITNGNYIKDICLDGSCSSDNSVDDVNIVFTRPDPDASIRETANSSLYSSAKIYIAEPRGKAPDRIITIRSTGQISVSTQTN